MGDAACAYDPLSAQGIVKALCDGEAAADAIAGVLAGAGEAPLLAYQDGMFARFRDYLRLRQQLYGLERRWLQAPFCKTDGSYVNRRRTVSGAEKFQVIDAQQKGARISRRPSSID